MPENRLKLSAEVKSQIVDELKLDVNKKLLQSSLHKKKIYLTLRDLSNLKSTFTREDGDNLQLAVKYLIEEKGKKITFITK